MDQSYRKQEVVKRLQVTSGQVPNVIRSVAFSVDGKFFAAGGDDKEVYIYNVETWSLLGTFKSQKKLSCVLFTPDNSHVLAANKYGDVLAAPVPDENCPTTSGTMDVIMGHFCSIIMSMSISRIERHIATTDRDGKMRITALPKNIDDGAHDIVSFCLGHEKFVSSCSFVVDQGDKRELIVSGGGDGLLKLWNPENGEELDSVNVSMPVLSMVPQKEEDVAFAALDGSSEIVSLSVKERKILTARHETGIPTITGVDVSDDGTLWIVGGPIGNAMGMRFACMRWNENNMEFIDRHERLRELENCSMDDKPLSQRHLPDYMEKKARIFS